MFSYSSETVTHTINISALDTQDVGEGVSDVFDLQQNDMMERMFHVGQLIKQIDQANPSLFLFRKKKEFKIDNTVKKLS